MEPLIDHLGGPVHALRLKARGGIWAFRFAIQPVAIESARGNAFDVRKKISSLQGCSSEDAFTGAIDVEFHIFAHEAPKPENCTYCYPSELRPARPRRPISNEVQTFPCV